MYSNLSYSPVVHTTKKLLLVLKVSFWGLFRTWFASHFFEKSCKLLFKILTYYFYLGVLLLQNYYSLNLKLVIFTNLKLKVFKKKYSTKASPLSCTYALGLMPCCHEIPYPPPPSLHDVIYEWPFMRCYNHTVAEW